MAEATFTVGDGGGGAGTQVAWSPDVALPAALLAAPRPSVAYLNTVVVQPGIASLRTSLSARDPSGTAAGPELTAAWESSPAAVTIQAGTLSLRLPGPNSPLATFRDAAEPYTWRPGNDRGDASRSSPPTGRSRPPCGRARRSR